MLSSGWFTLYGPTMKCGKENVKNPNPIIITPYPTHFNFEAPTRPPKYETGIRQKKLATS